MKNSTLSLSVLGVLLVLGCDIMKDTTTTYAFAPLPVTVGHKRPSPSSRTTKPPNSKSILNMAWTIPELVVSDGTSRFDSKWYTPVEHPLPRTMVFSDVHHHHYDGDDDDDKILDSYFWMKPCCDDWPTMVTSSDEEQLVVESSTTGMSPKTRNHHHRRRHYHPGSMKAILHRMTTTMIRTIPRKIYLLLTEPFHLFALFLMSKIIPNGRGGHKEEEFLE